MADEYLQALTATAKRLWVVESAQKNDRRFRWFGLKWDPQKNPEMCQYYVDMAEPVLRALYDAGFVAIDANLVPQMVHPRRRTMNVAPKINLKHGNIDLGELFPD